MSRQVFLQLPAFDGVSGLVLRLIHESTIDGTVANTGGDTLTAVANGGFTATVAESLAGVYNVDVLQGGVAVASGGKANFDSGTGTVVVDSDYSIVAATQATAAALDASKIPRLTDAIAAGAAVRRNKVAATSTTLDETLEATP